MSTSAYFRIFLLYLMIATQVCRVFFCFFDKKKIKKNTNRFHVAVKCGKNENRWHTIRIRLCHKRWIDVLCYSLLNRLTAKWNLLVLYNKKERKTTNLPSTTRLFKARRRQKTRIDSMLPSSVVRTKTGGIPRHKIFYFLVILPNG